MARFYCVAELINVNFHFSQYTSLEPLGCHGQWLKTDKKRLIPPNIYAKFKVLHSDDF